MDLTVELDREEIVVTKPPSTFLLAYRKSVEERRLVLSRSRMPPMSHIAAREFRAKASQAANDKAREVDYVAPGRPRYFPRSA